MQSQEAYARIERVSERLRLGKIMEFAPQGYPLVIIIETERFVMGYPAYDFLNMLLTRGDTLFLAMEEGKAELSSLLDMYHKTNLPKGEGSIVDKIEKNVIMALRGEIKPLVWTNMRELENGEVEVTKDIPDEKDCTFFSYVLLSPGHRSLADELKARKIPFWMFARENQVHA